MYKPEHRNKVVRFIRALIETRRKGKMNNIEVIGIDHGWSQMKTSNTCFNTSIKELANAPAFHDNVLEYDN